MESQHLAQYSPISHGSACASVTSKEVHTNQDPLDGSASKINEYDKLSTKANSQQETTPVPTDVSENTHHASPHTAQVPLPQNGPYSQQCMMTTNQANPSSWPIYGHPYTMPYTPYQMSPMYYPPGPQPQYTQYTPTAGTSLSATPPEPGNTLTKPPSTKSDMTPVNKSVRPPPILTSSNDFLNWIRTYVKFLQNSNLGDIIPTTDGRPIRQVTYDEQTFLYNTFQTFAPPHLLPTWVKDILSVDYTDIMKVLSKSFEKIKTDTQDANDLITITNIHYNGSTPAVEFETKITNTIERLNNNGISINDKLACQLIMKGLSGEYRFLRYARHRTQNMTIAELFLDIHAIYEDQQESERRKPSYSRIPKDDKNISRVSSNINKAKTVTRNSQKASNSKSRTVKTNNVSTSHNSFDKNNDSINESPDKTIHLNNQYDLHLRPDTY
ncbi:LAFE_0H08460g1_2 [Lachancea fermentati]|uniref:LAFE_0H08460g1_2 n=1 Tax=Lachancea fermentati TaxID=4955 RepID=A0A1G4MKD7_LACFM|nr:LAFE_0H08460g1_2 [Lachancea fermentati]